MPATFVAVGHSAWTGTATSRTTGSITVQSGDLLVAIGGTRDGDENVSSVTGGGLTWTSQASNAASGRPTARIYTATANTNGSIAATFNFTGTIVGGGSLYAFRGGTGTANAICTQAKSQSITASTYSLAVIWIANETAEDGSTRTFDTSGGWTTYNEQTYSRNIGEWTVYGGYYSDRGNSSGADTVGLTNLGAPDTVIAAIEITGTAPPVALATTDTGTSTDTGALTVAHSLDVSDSGTSTDTGALGVNYGLAATDAGSSSDSGTLSLASEFFIITNPVVLSTSPDTVNVPRTAGPETVVRLQALDGTWEVCGVDRANKVWPENVSLTSDSWGPKTATFDLKRDPANTWPDITAYTPVKVEVDGQLVWSGRVTETPSRDGADTVMSVSCEGWQHHLDDDIVQSKFVINDLSLWKDTKTYASAPLNAYLQNGQVQQDDGVIVLGFPNNSVTSVGCAAGVTIDLGPNNTAIRGSVTFEASTFSAGSFTVYIKGHSDLPTILSGGSNAASGDAATNATLIGNANAQYRYWSIILYKNAGGTATETADWLIRVTDIKLFSSTGYESGGSSILKASDVVKSVVAVAPLISTNTSRVSTPLTSLQSYAPNEYRTPREHWNAVNSWHGWTTKVDPFRRLNYYAKPSRPKYTVGNHSFMEMNDSAGSAGAEIYNKVVVTGNDPAGNPVSVTRVALQNYATSLTSQSDLTCPNPSFDTNVTGWSGGNGGPVRTTTGGQFLTAPAAGSFAVFPNGNLIAQITLNGTAVAGKTYVFSVAVRGDAGPFYGGITINGSPTPGPGANFGAGWAFATSSLSTTFQRIYCSYTPQGNETGLILKIGAWSGLSTLYVDDVRIERSIATLPNRRNFNRAFNLQVNIPLPSDGILAAAIGDAWLANHSSTTFRGDITLTGASSLRDRISGQPIPLHQLLADTDELMYFSDRIDPNTGAQGRNARIASVTYSPADDKASVTLDNTRTDFDTLLTRLGAL
jgi:hypothetical protein